MTFVVGLTGGIASGKTTVANVFHQHFGIDIVDADVIARQVVEVGSKGLKAIEEHFGHEILQANGQLDRATLRSKIFADETQKAWLNNLLHPMIREKMLEQLSSTTSPYALLVVPLLIENNLQSLANRILVVDVDTETQISRTMARDNVSEQQVRAILAAQASREQRLAQANDVVKNSAENQKLLPQITELHQKYLAICGQNR